MVFSMSQDAEYALALMHRGGRVVIDGEPESGKSALLRSFLDSNAAMPAELRRSVLAVAPLGEDAGSINGLTVNGAFHFDPLMTADDVLPGGSWDIEGAAPLLSTVETLVIDDANFLNSEHLQMINVALQRVHRNGEEFGGVQLIAAGDFEGACSPLSPGQYRTVRKPTQHYAFISFDGAMFTYTNRLIRLHAVIVERGEIVADFGTWLNPMSDLGNFGVANAVPPGGLAIAPSLENFWPLLRRQVAGSIVVGDHLEMAEDAGYYQARGLDMDLGGGIDAEDLDMVVEGDDVVERAHNMARAFLAGEVQVPPRKPAPATSQTKEGALFVPVWAPAAPLRLDQTRATDSDNAWAAFSGANVEVDDESRLAHVALMSASWAVSRGVWTSQSEQEVRSRAALAGLGDVCLPVVDVQELNVSELLTPGTQVVFTGRTSVCGEYGSDDFLTALCTACLLEYQTKVTEETCDVLIAHDPASMSGKAKDARNLGIPIIALSDFEAWVPQNALPLSDPAIVFREGNQVAFRGSLIINGVAVTHGARMRYLCSELGLIYKVDVSRTQCDALVTDRLDATDMKMERAKQFGTPLITAEDFARWVNEQFEAKRVPFDDNFFIPVDVIALYGPDDLLAKIDESKA